MDLKESMLGPFMLLALRGDSSFIQVSAIIYRANIQQARLETGLGILSWDFLLSFPWAVIPGSCSSSFSLCSPLFLSQ